MKLDIPKQILYLVPIQNARLTEHVTEWLGKELQEDMHHMLHYRLQILSEIE